MARKQILIIEDNKAILESMTHLVEDIASDIKVYAVDNISDAYKVTLEHTVDIFIVDIILDTSKPGDVSGLNFVARIRLIEKYMFAPVIIVTSLDNPKMYSYEKLHCYGYIEKPFDPEKVKALIKQVMQFPMKNKEKITINFRKEGIVIPVDCDDIVFVESIGHKLQVHMKNRDVLEVPYKTLKQLLIDVEGSELIQCNRNTIVNKDYVKNLDYVNRYIELRDEHGRIELGITFKNELKEVFKLI